MRIIDMLTIQRLAVCLAIIFSWSPVAYSQVEVPVSTPKSDAVIADLPDANPPTPPKPPIPEESKNPRIQAVCKAFTEPKGATRLAPDARLWIDKKKRRVVIDGYVAMREGPLEMFACPAGTKEHESVVALITESQYVHAALLAIDATPGRPVKFDPVYSPPAGDRIAIWVLWRDDKGKRHRVKAQQWVKKQGTDEALDVDFIFAGSQWWTDPQSGRDFYTADDGDLVCVSNFTSATLDIPIESSKANAALDFGAFTKNIPDRFTPLRIVMIPMDPPLNAKSKEKQPKTNKPDTPEESPAKADPFEASAS